MCKFASFIITKDREFWLETSDSHSEIITANKLHEVGAHGPNLVKVEITPSPKLKVWPSLKAWDYKIDQDILPEWHIPATTEKRARAALLRRYKAGFKTVDASGATGLKELSCPEATYVDASGATGLKELSCPKAHTVDASGCNPELIIKAREGATIIR